MIKLSGMGTNGFVTIILILILVSNTCNASLVFHLRKLITSEPNNGPTPSQVSPVGSPVKSNTKSVKDETSPKEKHEESQVSNQNDNDNNNNKTSPADSKGTKKNDNENENSGAPSNQNDDNNNKTSPADSKGTKKNHNENENSGAPILPAGEKDDSNIDGGNVKADNETTPKLDYKSSCEGSLISCRDKEMLACVEASKDGSKEVFLVLQNDGESSLKINVNLPNTLQSALPALEVPKHDTRRMDISTIMGKSTELIVNSENTKCMLHLVNPVSSDNLIKQLTFYSKQVTPIYAAYASFLLALLLLGIWGCCKLRKTNNRQENGIPYQELEMGLPESTSAANVDTAEGWDDNWDDDDDWDEGNAVKSPLGNGVRNVSADGLTSRSSKKDDGWENNWDD